MLTRADIEHTLRESGAVIARKNWWRHDKLPYQSFGLGWKHITFGYPICTKKRVLYSDLTSKLWTELTGLQFHPMEEK